MEDLGAALGRIMSDPEAMAQIAQLSKRFTNEGATDASSTRSTDDTIRESDVPVTRMERPETGRPEAVPAVALPDLQRGGGSEELLRALRPFVSESRRKKIDSMIGVMSAAKLFGSVRGR